MIRFGNIDYMVYIVLASAITLVLYIAYLVWKRRALSLLLRNPVLREKMVAGPAWVARLKAGLVVTCIVLFAIVLLRPQWGERMRQVHNEGTDLVIALDVSRSMMAGDVAPSRLERAKDAVRMLVDSLEGDRVGLILFAGDAFLQCPLTNDLGAFSMFLNAASPDSIRLQGTDLGAALRTAHRLFAKKRLTSRVLVLITDGEDHEGAISDAIGPFREAGIAVYPVGIGTNAGDTIPLKGDDGQTGSFLRDGEGKVIRTKKNTVLLERLAYETGGRYLDISRNLSDVYAIIRVLEKQKKNDYGTRMVREMRERYQIFAALLAVLLALEVLIPGRRRSV